MPGQFAAELEDRFVRYARVDSQSDESSPTEPSTDIQLDMQNLLVEELKEIGAADVVLTSYGAVTATIPATNGMEHVPTIGFLAHVDTSPGFNATGVEPIVHRNYDGSVITFPTNAALKLDPAEYPYLASKVGDDIVTASGDTLLGADDKAGVAIVMAMAKHLLESDLPHGKIRIGFTPDEEVGRGVNADFPADLGADFAYTLDGADLGEVVYETFSADAAVVNIRGVSTHPGQAKDTMVNALHLAAKIISTLPHVTQTPETTDGRQGFIHVYSMTGGAAEADLHFILRDFEEEELNRLGDLIRNVCETVQLTEPRAQVTCTITPQYRNMRYWLENDMRPVDLAREACRQNDIEPFSPPTRGGTDGSRLTELGVPTPNLFTGMQNFHGPLEWVSIQDMEKATSVCISLAKLWSEPYPSLRAKQSNRSAG